MGAVYLARNRLTGRPEALKVVARTDAADRLLREVRAAAALAHPNVVAAYSARLVGGVPVFAMEYVDGEDLYRLVRDRGPLPVPEACEYARQAALGLHHAHGRGMVHRDVKPHNLIRARDGTVKVLDFGLARAVIDPPADPGLTPDQTAVGTPDYMAPELATDPKRADARADVYGLGCTLYFLLTGGPPFGGVTPYEVVQRHRDREPEPLDRACPGVPAGLARVVARMLAKDPAGRYPTAADAAAALAPFTEPGVSPPPATERAAGRAAALRVVAAGAGVIGLIVLLVVGVSRPWAPADPSGTGPRPAGGVTAGTGPAVQRPGPVRVGGGRGRPGRVAGRGRGRRHDRDPGRPAELAVDRPGPGRLRPAVRVPAGSGGEQRGGPPGGPGRAAGPEPGRRPGPGAVPPPGRAV